MKKFCLFSLSVILFISCNSGVEGNEKAEEMLIQLQRDSLALKGGHGYFAMNFIVGRLKQMLITKGLSYEVNILSIAPELTEQEIGIRILDSINYQISFPKNEKEATILKGEFGKQAGNEKIQLIMNKAGSFANTPKLEVIEALKNIDYMFKVYSY